MAGGKAHPETLGMRAGAVRTLVRPRGAARRVRTRFVQKCTVRNGPLTLADRSSCRSSNRSSPHEVLGAVSGLHHPLVAVRGPSRREPPDDVERRLTDSNRPRGTRTRCCNGQTNVFVKHRSDIDHQRQDHRSLQARRLRTSPHTGLTLAPYRAFLHESGSYPDIDDAKRVREKTRGSANDSRERGTRSRGARSRRVAGTPRHNGKRRRSRDNEAQGSPTRRDPDATRQADVPP